MPKTRSSFLSPTLRASSALLLALLSGLVPACSDDERASGGSSGSAGRVGAAGAAGAQPGGAGGSAGAGDSGSGAVAGANDEAIAGSAGATGEAGSRSGTPGEAGNAGTATAGSGGSGGSGEAPVGDICEQVAAYLTSCGQSQGAGEAAQNCDPNLGLSQCIVPCLLAKPCEDVGNWPAPILGCVSECGG